MKRIRGYFFFDIHSPSMEVVLDAESYEEAVDRARELYEERFKEQCDRAVLSGDYNFDFNYDTADAGGEEVGVEGLDNG